MRARPENAAAGRLAPEGATVGSQCVRAMERIETQAKRRCTLGLRADAPCWGRASDGGAPGAREDGRRDDGTNGGVQVELWAQAQS